MRPHIICTEDALLHPVEDTLKIAFFISLGVHTLFFLTLFLSDIFAPKKEATIPQEILVHSVKLLPKAKKPPTPALPPPAPSMANQSSELEIAQMKAPSVEPEPAPVEKEAPPQPEAKSQKDPEPEAAPEPVQQTSTKTEKVEKVEKTAKVEKPQKVQKVVSSKAKPKTKASPPTPAPTSKKSSSKKGSSQTTQNQKKLNKEVADNIQSLLAQARQQRKGGSGSGTGSSKGTSGGTPCGQVSTLSCEKGGTGTQDTGEYGVEASEEDIYISNLIRLIQLSLTIPDKEPVSLRITLSRSGALQSLTILSSSSSRNKKAVEKGLSTIRFPSFGSAYGKEAQHSFSLRLTREMEWVRF